MPRLLANGGDVAVDLGTDTDLLDNGFMPHIILPPSLKPAAHLPWLFANILQILCCHAEDPARRKITSPER
jgi:hypothetical protein